jgi:hypothetical protein
MPLMITEFGVPSSPGSAHRHARLQPGRPQRGAGHADGRPHAGRDAQLGLAGGFIFEWTDEWHFGIVATDPLPNGPPVAIYRRPRAAPVTRVTAWTDASYIHLGIRFARRPGQPGHDRYGALVQLAGGALPAADEARGERDPPGVRHRQPWPGQPGGTRAGFPSGRGGSGGRWLNGPSSACQIVAWSPRSPSALTLRMRSRLSSSLGINDVPFLRVAAEQRAQVGGSRLARATGGQLGKGRAQP